MKGRRLPDYIDWSSDWQPGDYSKAKSFWIVCTPNGEVGVLTKHTVTEHEDGTITVSPSILIYPHKGYDEDTKQAIDMPGWHGFLERGVWRSC